MREKQNPVKSENLPWMLQNSFLAIPMLIGGKPVQKRGIGENWFFFATHWQTPE